MASHFQMSNSNENQATEKGKCYKSTFQMSE